MSDLLDTSILVRYLVGEPREMAERAALLIENENMLFITPGTIAETAFVLSSSYGVDRSSIVDSLTDLLGRRNIDTIPFRKELAMQALAFCRDSNRVLFADAMLWATAAFRDDRVITFDRRFPSAGIELVVPL